jgi:ribulose-phosphate 3-epimerase
MTSDPSLKSALKARARGISLGVMAGDLGDLRTTAERARSWGCDILHFDVMDGVFVPGLTAGPGFVKALDCGALRDVHLMVQDPAAQVAGFVAAGADIVTVHAEAETATAAIAEIRRAAVDRPVLAGLALMPGTGLDAALSLIGETAADLVMVLSLDPRTGTPPDIAAACKRLTEVHARLDGTALLAFDGGVTADTMAEIAAARPDMVVSGSAVFKAPDPARAFRDMAVTLAQPAPLGAPL